MRHAKAAHSIELMLSIGSLIAAPILLAKLLRLPVISAVSLTLLGVLAADWLLTIIR